MKKVSFKPTRRGGRGHRKRTEILEGGGKEGGDLDENFQKDRVIETLLAQGSTVVVTLGVVIDKVRGPSQVLGYPGAVWSRAGFRWNLHDPRLYEGGTGSSNGWGVLPAASRSGWMTLW